MTIPHIQTNSRHSIQLRTEYLLSGLGLKPRHCYSFGCLIYSYFKRSTLSGPQVGLKVFMTTFLFCMSIAAKSETVTLKNGNVLKGSIAEMSEENLVIDTADMGRITVKRRTIQSIRDGDEGIASQVDPKGGPVNININNSQSNDQKLDQKTDQNVNQTQDVAQKNDQKMQPKEENKNREWQSGVFGRFSIMSSSVSLTFNSEEIKEGPFSKLNGSTGVHWDILGYRSNSWWSLSLFGESFGIDGQKYFPELNRSVSYLGGRADFNFFKKVNTAQVLSQFYVGVSVGTATASIETKQGESIKLSFSGNGSGMVLGYDYLAGKNLGFTIGVSAFSATLDKFEFGGKKGSYQIPTIGNSEDKLELSGSCIFAGFIYNFDL